MKTITVETATAPGRVFTKNEDDEYWTLELVGPGGPAPGGDAWTGEEVVNAVAGVVL